MKEKFVIARFSSHGTRDYLNVLNELYDSTLSWNTDLFEATKFENYSDCVGELELIVPSEKYMYAIQKVYC